MDSQAELDIKLCNAASNGNTTEVIELLQKGANIEGGNMNPRAIFHTPLMRACARGHLDTVVALAQHGANLESKLYICGDTPLSFAFNNKHMPIVKFLLHNGVRTRSADLIFQRQRSVTTSWAYKNNLQEILCLILSAMPDDEVIKAADSAKDINLITIKQEIEKNKQALTNMLYLQKGHLDKNLCSDLTNRTTQLLAQITAHSFSEEYISYCLKTDIQSIMKQYFLDQKNKKIQISPLQEKQDNDVIFAQDNSDLSPTESSQKSYTDMIYEGFNTVTNGFFNLFNNKRKREDNDEKQQAEQNNPNKKRRLN